MHWGRRGESPKIRGVVKKPRFFHRLKSSWRKRYLMVILVSGKYSVMMSLRFYLTSSSENLWRSWIVKLPILLLDSLMVFQSSATVNDESNSPEWPFKTDLVDKRMADDFQHKHKTTCLQINNSKPCYCGTESRTGNSAQDRGLRVTADRSLQILKKTQKDAKHHQRRMRRRWRESLFCTKSHGTSIS